MTEEHANTQQELQSLRAKADLEVTSHSFLRDYYLAWSQRLNIYVLLGTAMLLFFTMMSEDFILRSLGLHADGFKWAEGGVAFLAFCLSLVDLTWNPASKHKAHDQAVNHYLRMNYEIRNLIGTSNVTREKMRWLEEEYLDVADLPNIPESQSLELKRHHLQKLAISRALELNPHQAIWWLSIKLWWLGPDALTASPISAKTDTAP